MHVVGVEFQLVSSCGKFLLAELLRELARQQSIANSLKEARQQSEYESSHKARPRFLNEYHSVAGSLVSPENASVPADGLTLDAAGSALRNGSVILNGDELDVFI